MNDKTKSADDKTKTKDSKGEQTEPKGSCFTIMPFGGHFDSYYEEIYIPAIRAAGLIARRADDLSRSSAIINDIWEFTQNAEIVLADLSGMNPNVFYELGLAHATSKPAILVSSSMDFIPFDLRSLRIIIYDKNRHNWGTILSENITQSINEVLSSPKRSVLPTFLNVVTNEPNSVTENELAMLELRNDMDAVMRQISALPTIDRPQEFLDFVPEVPTRRSIRSYMRKPIDYIVPNDVDYVKSLALEVANGNSTRTAESVAREFARLGKTEEVSKYLTSLFEQTILEQSSGR